MLQGKLDAVAIESPPYFHPQQAADAVDAGLHIYQAKPVAVDVPGCQSIQESARKASAKNRCFLVDFQTRTDPFYQEAIRRCITVTLARFSAAKLPTGRGPALSL